MYILMIGDCAKFIGPFNSKDELITFAHLANLVEYETFELSTPLIMKHKIHPVVQDKYDTVEKWDCDNPECGVCHICQELHLTSYHNKIEEWYLQGNSKVNPPL